MQFLWKNRLNRCRIFGQFGFKKQNLNQILVFCTSLISKQKKSSGTLNLAGIICYISATISYTGWPKK